MAVCSSSYKSLIVHRPILEYILEKNAYPKEHEQLKELREATAKKYEKGSIMNVTVDEAQFLSMLLKVMNAKTTMEIGVFTGYSLLATALALPDDGQITAIDVDKEAYETGLPFIQKAGVEHKINFVHSDAFLALNDLINGEDEVRFDFIFVDAHKPDYIKLHEQVMKLVKVGGIVAYDNTLWFGSVAYQKQEEEEEQELEQELPEFVWRSREYILQFNSFLVADRQVESSLLSIGDGVTLCRRLY